MADERRNSSDGLTESSPLLGDQPRRLAHRPALSVTSITIIHIPKAHNNRTIVNLLCLIMFIAASAGGFLGIPQARLIEDLLCHAHYDMAQSLDGPIDEDMCKLDSIQSDLAFVLAIQIALDAIISFVAAFPWSLVADRYGYFVSVSSSLCYVIRPTRTPGLVANLCLL